MYINVYFPLARNDVIEIITEHDIYDSDIDALTCYNILLYGFDLNVISK